MFTASVRTSGSDVVISGHRAHLDLVVGGAFGAQVGLGIEVPKRWLKRSKIVGKRARDDSLAVPAVAQEMPMATPVCPRDAEPIPASLAGWSNRTAMTAATEAASVGQAALVPGAAVDLALADTPAVNYVVRPSHPGGSVNHGGMARLVIATAGTYRVAIGSGAWVDLVKDKASLVSVGHGHGPNCSGIRKMVDFVLQPGSYILQIAGNGEARIPVLVAKLP